MRLDCAVTLLAAAAAACASSNTAQRSECFGENLAGEPPPEIRYGRVLDSVHAGRGLARLVFLVRSGGRDDVGRPLVGTLVLLGDSLSRFRALRPNQFLSRFTDDAGVAVLDSVPLAYTDVALRRIGSPAADFTVRLRAGFTDTLTVTLPQTRICLRPVETTVSKRWLQN